MNLWSQEAERKFFEFFEWALSHVSPEKLSYKLTDGKYVAYYPKVYTGRKETL